MQHFLRLAREMLNERATLAWALLFAFVSAAGLGAGLLAIVPLLEVILGSDGGSASSLADLALAHNAAGTWPEIPPVVLQRLPADPFQGVALVLGGLLVLTLVGATANFLHLYLTGTVAARTVARIRQMAFERAVRIPLGRVVTRGPSDFVARVVRDSAELQRGFVSLTSKAVAQLTKGFAAVLVAVWIEPKLTLIAIPTAVLVGVILRKLGKRIRRGTRGSLKSQEGLLRVSTETLQGLRAVKASTGEAEAAARFGAINDQVVHHELRVRTARALSGPIVETLAVFVLVGLAMIAARMILRGSLDFNRFIFALFALGTAGASFRPLAGLVAEVQAATAPAGRICEILDEVEEEPAGERRPNLPRHVRSILLERVSLCYPGSDRPALRDVSVEIGHGERVAVVGPNGAGKTTLVSLVPRLLVPDSGRVLIDGVDVAAVALRSLREQIGVVTQETVLFRGSVAENIAFGRDGASREQIEDAARRARADSFIENLPDGYDADLAEQGGSLSGGQRQRLAIARAILRDPSMLILDEATSQIDAESEAQINAALKEFCRGRTSLIVAHRLSTVRGADRILVMDEGRVVEQGSHDALLERCDLYRRLTQTQLVAEAR